MNVNRSSQHLALVLRTAPFGESNAFVDLLTPDEGVVPAVAYGVRSQRSSLRGKVVPYAQGTVWLYRDRRKRHRKIVDFDVVRYALTIPENVALFYHVSVWMELVSKTHPEGEEGTETFTLLTEGLELIERQPPAIAREAYIRQVGYAVVWRYLQAMGIQPDLLHCGIEERPFRRDESVYYDERENQLVGQEWSTPTMVPLPPSARAFLHAVTTYPLSIAGARALSESERAAVRAFVYTVVRVSIDLPINALSVARSAL